MHVCMSVHQVCATSSQIVLKLTSNKFNLKASTFPLSTLSHGQLLHINVYHQNVYNIYSSVLMPEI